MEPPSTLIGKRDAPITLVDLLDWRATEDPARTAFVFLRNGETIDRTIDYTTLRTRARAVAAALEGCATQRALLLFAPGLDYVAAFLGCLYAGVVAVPAYPPDPGRIARTLPRLRAMAASSKPTTVLTTSDFLAAAPSFFEQALEFRSMRWLAVDALEESDATAFHDPVISGDSLAFLQYTSGSTGNPKGVALTHSNVLHNLGRIRDAFEMTESSVSLMWVPPYHDMGLIGGVLAPLAVGIPAYLMSPVDFLLRPMRWLRTIARYRVTVSCAPNFAYDLCVRKSTPEERSALDLSSWRVAGNGAEPLRAETIERFVRAFEPSGFRSDALRPCYGLAEATLLVTMAKARSGGATVAHFDGSSLERGCARPPIAGKASVQLVSSGQAASDLRVVIVDPDSMSPCEAGRVGEVWIAGPSVATGYFAAQEETMLVFDAQLEKERYLRTGDLGFLDGDELFVTGRIKDVIIVRGCNHYPQDIETTVMECHSAMRPGCGAAFAVTIEGEERVIVAQEMDPGRGDPALLLAIARRAILEHHDVPLHAVLLLGPRTIPKTSSGKIQRQACRASYLAGTLETLARWPGSTSK